MPKSIDVQLDGISFQLLADYGLYWPDHSILFVADSHFGKEATFRRSGIPVPMGTTDGTLSRITRMLRHTKAKKFCVLGDLLHARSSIATDVQKSLENFFMEFASVEMSLVKGNHDAHVGALPSNWPFTIIDPGQMIDVVAIGHHPGEMPKGASIYLCGHIHPAVRIASRTEGLGRLPCFWYSCGQMVLPAIGEFTGSHLVKPSADDDLWIIGDNQIFSYSKTTIQ